ncbi:unnamed protein product [Brassica oleracea var. botrytis]|uniref:C3H1-type domain-containing protein n=1 Tax=Brassica oleracea TaxID=3712 RepID=A0A3P6FCD4_BRAOL|nr:unnamed protein product [Brassica oleracea]
MGLCGTCIKPIMLLEKVSQGDNEAVKVDFDDKLSWEYLFKVYWLCLKEELSLTVDELTRANNPWKVVPYVAPKVESQNDHTRNRAYSADNSAVDVAVNGTKRRRTSDSPTLPSKLDTKNPSNTLKKLPGDTSWATKELLEFLSFMRNGDTSVLSQFDVQGLLLDYIKKKDLRDPVQESQVICDQKLVKLFGRQRVGHFEMLKLLESHFLIQEKPKDEKTKNGETAHAVHDPPVRDRRRKMRKKTDGGVQNENLDATRCLFWWCQGDILKTGATLQAMRINEALETDIVKFKHLRDRAKKLGLLESPEERQRLLQEVPEDPSMDPSHASAEDAGLGTRKQDNHIKAQSKGPKKKGDTLDSLGNNAQKKYDAPVLRSRNAVHATNKDDCSKVRDSSSDNQVTGKDDEENEIWHYRDPTGKIQGPFSMVQLRRWKSSGHFPPYLRISKAHENQDESVLLTDALAGRFDKATTLPNSSLLPQEPRPSPHDSGSTGVDVNGLQTNSIDAKKQVVTLAPCSAKVEDGSSVRPQPQVSCPASTSVVPGHVVAPAVRETSGTDQSSAVRADVKAVQDGAIVSSVHAPNLNQEIHFPSPTLKLSPEDLEAQAAETIQSLSSCVLVNGPSGVTWGTTTTTTTTDAATTTSSVLVTGGQLSQVTQQNAVDLGSPSVKPIDLATGHATATQTSDNTQVVHSSGWPAIVADPDECDESVSDLLAEVEAMEQNGLPSSPTSTFHCDVDDDLTKAPEKDFFNPVARMSLASETCRMDVSHPSIPDNVAAGKNSMDTEAKDHTLFSHCGTAGPELLLFTPPAPASISQNLTLTTTTLRLGSETSAEAGSVERCSKSVSGVGFEPSPRSSSLSSSSHESARGNTERSSRGNGSQQRRTGGNSRDRQWWNNGHNSSFNNSHNCSFNNSHKNRQWPCNSSHGCDHGSGSHTAHPPKGLKICKFYESGYCKKGASCSFWHP